MSKLLNFGINTDIRHQDIYTPLFLATLRVNPIIVKELVNNKVNIDDVSTETNITALMEAVTKSEKIVDILLKSNCDVNLTDSNGKTALMYESESNGKIPYKLYDDNRDFAGFTSIYRLIRRQFGKYKFTSRNFKPPNINKIIDKLIKANSNINLKDNKGETALFYAVKKGKIETIGQLITAGININDTNNSGYSPINGSNK